VTLDAVTTGRMREPARLRLGSLDVVADLSGALILEEDRIAIVADLHLEKGSSAARRGSLLPPYDTRQTLAALAAMLERLRPGTVIALGDSFHDPEGPGRLGPSDASALREMQRGRDWIWIGGNHDPHPLSGVGGQCASEIAIADVVLRHEPRPGETGAEIAGHLHPAGKVRMHGRSVRRRCFASDGRRCVMPAFGALAGGLNVLDHAFRGLMSPRELTAYVLGAERIYAIRHPLLVAD
jgi:DNA ligase-associated metallophosphoesterase